MTIVKTVRDDEGKKTGEDAKVSESDPHNDGFIISGTTISPALSVQIKASNVSDSDTVLHEGSHVADRTEFLASVVILPKVGWIGADQSKNIEVGQSEMRAFTDINKLSVPEIETLLNTEPYSSRDLTQKLYPQIRHDLKDMPTP